LLIATIVAGIGMQVLAIGSVFTASLLAGRAITGAAAGKLTPLLVVLIALILPTAVFGWADLQFCHRMSYRMLADLGKTIYDQIDRLAPAFLLERRSGDVAVAAMSDVELLELFTSHVLPVIFVAGSVPAAGLVALGLLHPFLAVTLAPFLVAMATVPAWFGRRAVEQGKSLRDATGAVSSDVVDAVQGIREIVILGAQESALARLAGSQGNLSASATAHGRRAGLEKAIGDALTAMGMLAVLVTATALVRAHALPAADYPASIVLAGACFLPLIALSGVGRELNRVAAATDRIDQLLRARPSVTDRVTVPPQVTKPVVEYRKVSFSYQPGSPDAVHDVSFTIAPGETVALVGHSGAGKTTCANLLLRLWDPRGGSITVGGYDLRDFPQDDLRHMIGYVPQDVYLFNISVTDNIRLGRQDATEADIRRAAEMAQCTEFIDALPQGWDTVLGERGLRLSGGERQRIAVARALLKDAPIIILDEAASSLDAESEQAMQRALGALMQHKTTLIIAHRPSTIRAASRLVVLSEGQVVESGTYNELIRSSGTFAATIQEGIPG
jgi:ABC-type multidrug transport system fused ATPase/permease subunit